MPKNIFVTITGRANTGKSSLINLLVGEKVAIVSEKPQTTRTRINGILNKDDVQYVFIDTPGMHRARNKLSEHMVKHVRSSITDVDAVILMADCTKKISYTEEELIESLKKNNIPAVLLLNKVDLIKDKTLILNVMNEYSKLYGFSDIIPVSVLKKENTDKILTSLEKFAAEGEHLFPEDITTDQSEKVWLAEIVREKLLNKMQQEIPHGIAVEIESMKETNTNKGKPIIDLGVVIICEKNSHKGMIIGKQGSNLKNIGMEARNEMEEYFGCKVNMKLWVKVKEDWRNRDAFIINLGLGAE